MRRKATALFLLMITVTFTVRPVIAMHYCMGELHSYNLYLYHDASALCPEHGTNHEARSMPDAEAMYDAGPACCAQPTPVYPLYTPSADNCCDDTLLELSTDDYQNKTEPFISRVIPNPVTEGMLLLGSILNPSVPETNSLSLFQDFPPKGLFLQDVSLRTYICIYRI